MHKGEHFAIIIASKSVIPKWHRLLADGLENIMGKDAHATAAREDARPAEGRDERLARPHGFERTRGPRVPSTFRLRRQR